MRGYLVSIPLFEEMEYVYAHLKSLGGVCHVPLTRAADQYPFAFTMSNGISVDINFHVLPDMGNLAAAANTVSVLWHREPRMAFLIGLAGSLNPERKLGDVAIASTVKAFFPDKIKRIDPTKEVFGTGVDPDGRVVIDERKRILKDSFLRFRRTAVVGQHENSMLGDYLRYLRTRERALPLLPVAELENLPADAQNLQPKPFLATIFGSDMVIDSDEFVEFLRERDAEPDKDYYAQVGKPTEADQRRKLYPAPLEVVDMESLGYFSLISALSSNKEIAPPMFFALRGISDFSSGKSTLDQQSKEIRRRAVINATIVLLNMIEYFDTDRRIR